DGIRDRNVTGVQTCALPICKRGVVMSKLKVGFIGCGSIARHCHLLEYHANEGVEIVAVCDIVIERAEEMASLYQAKAYKDYEKVLQEEEIDAISVCLPNFLHA